MIQKSSKSTLENTEIDLLTVYQADPDILYSDADRSRIDNWNEQCRANQQAGPFLLTSRSLWWLQRKTKRRLDWCPLHLYCLIQSDIARTRHDGDDPLKEYCVDDLCALHPEIQNWRTANELVDALVDAGLLKEIRNTGYYRRANTGTLGPVFEMIATVGDDTDTTFENFPSEQQQFGSTLGLPQLPSWKTIKHYFWNEHTAGAALVMVATVPTIQLLNRVSQNGTVSTLDIGIAFLLTWFWLIGIFALVIGLLRRGFPNLLQRDRSSQ